MKRAVTKMVNIFIAQNKRMMNVDRRLEELDSLRGLAAITVLFSHFTLVYNDFFLIRDNTGFMYYLYKYTPIHMIWSGHEAVMLFFVLSGFVLMLPFMKNRKFSYPKYLIKRIIRIYIPTIFSVLVTYVIVVFFTRNIQVSESEWINSLWNISVNHANLLEHLFLFSDFNPSLNPVLWSLVHEMRISIFFPLIAFFVLKYDWKKVLFAGICLSIIGVIGEKIFSFSLIPTNYFITFHYIFMFIVGSLLANNHKKISNYVSNMNQYKKIILLLIAIFLYTFRWLFSSIEIIHNKFSNEWATTFGVCIFIIMAISSSRISKLLKIGALNYLGKISFSFYLYHLIVLLIFMKSLSNLPIPIILILTFIVTLVISSVSYYMIEKPSIMLGRQLTSNKKS